MADNISNNEVQNAGSAPVPTPAPVSTPAPQPPGAWYRRPAILAVLGLVVVAGLAGAAWWILKPADKAAEKKTVKIGLMMPLQGDLVALGTGIKQGFDFAQKEITANKVNVEVIVKSTNCEAEPAAKAMQELADAGVVAVVGEVCSSATLAAAPIANKHHIVLVSPASTSPDITTAGDYIFRTVPSDVLAGAWTADLLYNKSKIRKLAIVHGDEPYGKGLDTSVSENFIKLGGQVVASIAIKDYTNNVTTQTRQLVDAKPDAVYLAFNSLDTPVAVLLKANEMGLKAAIFGSDGLKDNNFVKDAGALAEGATIIGTSEGNRSFAEHFRAAYNADPQINAAQAYDAYQALVKALDSGATTGEAIKDAVSKQDFEGVSGHIKFDQNGDVNTGYVRFVVTDGKLVNQFN